MIDRFKDLIGISGKTPTPPAETPAEPPAAGPLGRLSPPETIRTAPPVDSRPPVAAAPPAPPLQAVPRPPGARTETTPPAASPDYQVADAYEFLFATELGDSPAAAAGPAITDEVIDRVAARVLQRLGDGPLRGEILRVVSDVAERLVREEIDRIRAAAKK